MHDAGYAVRAGEEFDFLIGRWTVRNRRLRAPLAGSDQWEEFEAVSIARPLFDGRGNEDEFRTDHDGGMIGMSFRFFDPKTRLWSIYWADSRRCGRLDPPVVGSFADGIGMFEGIDTLEGKPIRVRFIWSEIETAEPRWEQAFSADGGQTWETNWIMEFSPAGDER